MVEMLVRVKGVALAAALSVPCISLSRSLHCGAAVMSVGYFAFPYTPLASASCGVLQSDFSAFLWDKYCVT